MTKELQKLQPELLVTRASLTCRHVRWLKPTHSLQEGSRAADYHLPLSEIDQPFSFALRGQASPISVE